MSPCKKIPWGYTNRNRNSELRYRTTTRCDPAGEIVERIKTFLIYNGVSNVATYELPDFGKHLNISSQQGRRNAPTIQYRNGTKPLANIYVSYAT